MKPIDKDQIKYSCSDPSSCDWRNTFCEGCDKAVAKRVDIEKLSVLETLEQESTTNKNLEVDAVSRKELLKIYEDRFSELQKLKHLKDNKGAEDRQMGVNYCINILKELPSVTPQEPKSEWEQDHEILKAYSDGANEVLDKIRAEIDELYSYVEFDEDLKTSFNMVRLEEVLRVIDKYKAESEVEE